MAAIKLVILLCVAVYCTHAQVPELHQQQSHHKLKDAESDAIALLDKLTSLIKAAVDDAMKTIDVLLEVLDNTAENLIADLKRTLGAAITPFLDAIKELENEAAQAAVDITECVGTSIADIGALPGQFLSKVVFCLDTKLAAAKQYVNQTIIDIESTFDIIADLDAEIYVCGNKSLVQQIVCFTELTAKITADIASLPLKITDDVAHIKVYVASALPELALCGAGVVEDLGVQGAAIVAKVTVCALAKINGTTAKPFDVYL